MTKGVQDLMVAVERTRDAFVAAVRGGDLERAMALVTDDVALTTLPVGSGARGADELRRHLEEDVLPTVPPTSRRAACRAPVTAGAWSTRSS